MMHETRRSDTEEMLRSAIRELRDSALPRKFISTRMEAREILDEELARRLRWPRRALELIEDEAREVGERYAEELQDLADRLADEMAPLEERAERVLHVTRRRLAGFEQQVELPEVEGEEPEEVADGWLFDSRRDYLKQLRHYKYR